MEEITLILAGNYGQYTDWMYDNVLGKGDLKAYKYASTPGKIYGVRAKEVIVVGTFWEDVANADELYKLAKGSIY